MPAKHVGFLLHADKHPVHLPTNTKFAGIVEETITL